MTLPTLFGLISRGYFPKELPPSFNTRILATIAKNPTTMPVQFTSPNPSKPTKNVNHSYLARANSRRRLGIINPIDYIALSINIINNWRNLRPIYNKSRVSLTSPIFGGPPGRAFSFRHPESVDYRKTTVRSQARYLFRADISQFYHSVYTHSIAWALHGKALAKQHRNNSTMLGNILDKRIRHSQDNQTMGIPIGPDISFLIAEAILSVCDERLRNLKIRNFWRWIDDYEFGCLSLQEAESYRSALQEVLGDFELILNPDKTKIIEMPAPLENPCISYIRTFNLSGLNPDSQKYALISLFDSTFENLKSSPDFSILKFLLGKLRHFTIFEQNWSLYQNLLLQSVISDPSSISYFIDELNTYKAMSYQLHLDRINHVLNSLIILHAPINHSSEVAWSLWSQIILGLRIDEASIKAASRMNDSVVALLLLDAYNKKLTSNTPDFSNYQTVMTTGDLYDDQWLLAYEANVKNWLPSNGTVDHVNSDPCFSFLKNNNVQFYDDKWINKNKPKKKTTEPKPPLPGGGGGETY